MLPEAFKNTFFLMLYLQLTTCVEPTTISNLDSLKVTAVSADEQKIKTMIFFSSRLYFYDFPGVTL